jgi:hypothetical protein
MQDHVLDRRHNFFIRFETIILRIDVWASSMSTQTQRLNILPDKRITSYLAQYTEYVALVFGAGNGGALPSLFEQVVSCDFGRSACVYGAAAECKGFEAGWKTVADDLVDNISGEIKKLHGRQRMMFE